MLAIYTRISQDRENQVSIETQYEQGKILAEKLNISCKKYVDKSVSGTANLEERPSLLKLIQDIENGLITKVYVYEQSRLERNPHMRFVLKEIFEKHNIELYYESGLVKNDTETEMIGNLMSVVNNYYVQLTKKKITLALNYNAEQGKVHATPPYAYYKNTNSQYAINYEEADVVKEMFRLSLSGVGTNKIAEILNERGVLTPYNKKGGTLTTTNRKSSLKPIRTINKKDIKWNGTTVRNIIRNPIYKGVRVFKGNNYSVPEIVTSEYWQLVNDNLARNRNHSGKVITHHYNLKGFITCGKCGRNYYGRTRVSLKDNFYMCSSKRYKHLNCGNRSINIKFLDNLAEYFIREKQYQYIIDNARLVEEKPSNIIGINKLKKQLDDIKVKKENLIDAVQDKLLSNEHIKERMTILDIQERELINLINKELRTNNQTSYKDIITNIRVEFNNNQGVYSIQFFTPFNIKVHLAYIFTKNYKFIESYVSNHENLEIGDINLNTIQVENNRLKEIGFI